MQKARHESLLHPLCVLAARYPYLYSFFFAKLGVFAPLREAERKPSRKAAKAQSERQEDGRIRAIQEIFDIR
jgi:hypothetical protein